MIRLLFLFLLFVVPSLPQFNEAGATLTYDPPTPSGPDASIYLGTSVTQPSYPPSLSISAGYTVLIPRFHWTVRPFASYDRSFIWRGLSVGATVSHPLTRSLSVELGLTYYHDLGSVPVPGLRPPVDRPTIIDPAPVVITVE